MKGFGTMYFRMTKTKTTPVLQLVHGYRDSRGKSRQKIVASLGDMDIPEDARKPVAQAVEARLAGQQTIFPESPEVVKWTDAVVARVSAKRATELFAATAQTYGDEEVADGVLIDRIEHEDERELGPVLVLDKAWKELGLDNMLKAEGFRDSQISAAKVSVFNRLDDPCSEHALAGWAETVALDELLGENVSRPGCDRFYRVSDALLAKKVELEKRLRAREVDLFRLKSSIVLYDLTNSYFEGQAERNPKAKRGNSKEKRSDCPLLSLGLAIDDSGFPIAHQVFEGNRHDSKTLVEMVSTLRSRMSPMEGRPVIVVDGGVASNENLEHLRKEGYDYIVTAKRQSRSNFHEDFCDVDSFSLVAGRDGKKPVLVKRVETENELLVLCRSDGRRQKEDAMLSGAENKYLEGLAKLQSQIDNPKSRTKKAEDIQRRIGGLHKKHSRAAKHYEVEYDADSKKLSWSRRDEGYAAARELHGCYFLRSSIMNLGDEEVWNMYMRLTKVERAFRNLKSELGLRPIRHHREDRGDGHAWITVLAYHLMHWVEKSLESAGAPSTWPAVRRILQTHCYSTIIIPSKDGKTRYLRKAGRPGERQRKIYQMLNVEYRNLPVFKHVN
jgi:transposase